MCEFNEIRVMLSYTRYQTVSLSERRSVRYGESGLTMMHGV